MKTHQANQKFWDESFEWWKETEDKRGHWQEAHRKPELVLCSTELGFLKGCTGKRACVLGSGDNEVAFALAGLGCEVTSVDISERRIEVAKERAKELGIKQYFIQADVCDLSMINDGSFDYVYTGGHMSLWISDIWKFYGEAGRILSNNGLLMINEFHPIRRLWSESKDYQPSQGYFDRGPHRFTNEEGKETYEYYWTVADHIQAVINAGCRIEKMEEYELNDHEFTGTEFNSDKLPGHLMIIGRKV